MTKPSAALAADVERLRAFRDAYAELIGACHPERDRNGLTILGPGDNEREWPRLRQRAGTAAGAALPAYERALGAQYLLNNSILFGGKPFNPIGNWDTSLQVPSDFSPQVLTAIADQAIGVAEARLEEARLRERGLTGILASFVRWPRTLREAVGTSGVERTTATAVGYMGQFLLLLVTGVLTIILGQLVTDYLFG